MSVKKRNYQWLSMKKQILIIMVSVLILFLFTAGCTQMAYDKACETNTFRAYKEFVAEHPDSELAVQAKAKAEDIFWRQNKRKNNINNYEKFLQKYPQGNYTAEAKRQVEELNWQQAKSKNTISNYEQYLQGYPKGQYLLLSFALESELYVGLELIPVMLYWDQSPHKHLEF